MKTIVIVGPQGCGKSKNAPALAELFNCRIWLDNDSHKAPKALLKAPTENTLVLTNDDALLRLTPPPHVEVYTYQDAMTWLEASRG